jgi:1-acyl-sn-glycerol-3-phosphate acyltransferase
MAAEEVQMIEAILSRAGQAAARLYTAAFLRADVEWQAPLPPGAKILAANHPATTDPFYLLSLTAEAVSLLITGCAFKLPLAGAVLRASGHVPARLGSGGATVEALRRRLLAGKTVGIFPEGALSPAEGGLHPAHSGVARLALGTGAPVIPVGVALDWQRVRPFVAVIEGEAEPGRLYLRGPYAMTVGKALHFEGSGDDRSQVRAAAGRIMEQIGLLADRSARRLAARASASARPSWGGRAPLPSWDSAGRGRGGYA